MIPPDAVEHLILTVRGLKVILDTDLARLYGVTTKRLNEQFRRNRKRFPEDFAFQLTADEVADIRSQIAASFESEAPLRSQIATASPGRPGMRSQMATASKRNIRYRPYAFTEHGALQAANILNSQRAVQMSVFVIRAFVKMRETLLSTRDLAKKLTALEKQLTGRLDTHEVAIVHVLQELMQILNPPPPPPVPPKPRIGFTPQHKA